MISIYLFDCLSLDTIELLLRTYNLPSIILHKNDNRRINCRRTRGSKKGD